MTDTTTPVVDAATIAGYADLDLAGLTAPGPDLPDDDTLSDEIDTPPRNRWGVRPIPAAMLPVTVRRALWRWDRALDLAADMEHRAGELTDDTTLDTRAADADLKLVIAGKPAHHAADLAHQRDSLTRAAADLRTRATLVGEIAHEAISLDGEGDTLHPDRPALYPHLRGLVGPQVADYLATLGHLADQRAAIIAQTSQISEWWRRCARPDQPRRPEVIADTVDVPPAEPGTMITNAAGKRLTLVPIQFDAFLNHEAAALAPVASREPRQ